MNSDSLEADKEAEVNDLIGKAVYVEVRDSSYGYSSSMEWRKGSVVGVFIDGDVLVEYGSENLTRQPQTDVAFTDEVPPRLKIVMEEVKK